MYMVTYTFIGFVVQSLLERFDSTTNMYVDYLVACSHYVVHMLDIILIRLVKSCGIILSKFDWQRFLHERVYIRPTRTYWDPGSAGS